MRTSDPRFVEFMISEGVRAGKFPESRRPHYRALFAADPDGTAALIDRLAPGLRVTPVEEALPADWFRVGARLARPAVRESAPVVASTPVPPAASGEALPERWFPEAARRRELAASAAMVGRGQVLEARD